MPLQLNLAMTPSEIAAVQSLPADFAWMSCHFSPIGPGLTDLPTDLPQGALLILDDSIPCSGHSADLIADTLRLVIAQFACSGLLLDFQRPRRNEIAAVAGVLAKVLPCPVAGTPEYAKDLSCAVSLPPAPLHMPLRKYLQPWKNREIWLEAALSQEMITVTEKGATISAESFSTRPSDGFLDKKLCCRYVTNVQEDRITFTLFDTPDSLKKKLELAQSLGVTRAVGLYQELSRYIAAK